MFKLSLTLYRRADLTHAQFVDYWHNVHGPLGVSLADVLGIRKYVQVHAGESDLAREMIAARDCQPTPDGVAELWWDSEAARKAAVTSEAGRRAGLILRDDERHFCDVTRSTAAFGDEHILYLEAAR